MEGYGLFPGYEHGAPALGADGRERRLGPVGRSLVLEYLVAPGSIGFLEESAAAVHAYDDYVFVGPLRNDCGRGFGFRFLVLTLVVGILLGGTRHENAKQ